MLEIVTTRRGGPEVLEPRQATAAEPRSGEVRVRVAFAGVNFADVMVRLGLYPDGPALPAVVGYEVSGAIDAVGDDVPASRVGERVAAICNFGGYRGQVCVPAAQAFPLPDAVGLEAAAALPVNYLTATIMLRVLVHVNPGERVLVHSAAGGVGTAARQLVRLAGGEVVATASPAKHDLLREEGCLAVFDSRQERFADAVRAVTGGRGCDVALEPRHGRWIMESYRSLNKGGRLVLHGFSSATEGGGGNLGALKTLARVPWLQLNPVRLMNDNKAVAGVNLGRLWDQVDRFDLWMRQLLGWLAAGDIAPCIDRIYPADEAGAAHLRLQQRANVGKVLLDFRDGSAR
ncbi:MAG: zinc-binding dehydrogenase [Candidatus Krumholzibacteriia bacterium]